MNELNVLLNSQKGFSAGKSNSVNNPVSIPGSCTNLPALYLSRLRAKLVLQALKTQGFSSRRFSLIDCQHTYNLVNPFWLKIFAASAFSANFHTLISRGLNGKYACDMQQELKSSQNEK